MHRNKQSPGRCMCNIVSNAAMHSWRPSWVIRVASAMSMTCLLRLRSLPNWCSAANNRYFPTQRCSQMLKTTITILIQLPTKQHGKHQLVGERHGLHEDGRYAARFSKRFGAPGSRSEPTLT
jgi:hypothetical protein